MPSTAQPSTLMTVLLCVCLAAAGGAANHIVKAVLRGDAITTPWWLWLAGAVMAAVVVAVVFRSRGVRPAFLPFIGSQRLGFWTVCLIVIAAGLPGMTVAGFDPVDAVLTGIVGVVLGLLVLFLLRRWFLTPPDTPEGAETD